MTWLETIDDGRRIRLPDIDPGDVRGLSRKDAEARSGQLGRELDELLELLWAAGSNALLLVLQGMDTSGKDGTIRHILAHSAVQNTSVVAFKAPAGRETQQDFLWRVHAVMPPLGHAAILNRSHYEDVVAVRVRGIAPESVWSKRYDHINNFEGLLRDSGVIVLKFFLHISREEQERRLLERERDPGKSWKLDVADWRDRVLWNDYARAWEDVIARCGTPDAPWYVVPADTKWYRNFAVTATLLKRLRPYRKAWEDALRERGTRQRQLLDEFRVRGGKT